MDSRAWRATVRRVAKSRTQLQQLSTHTVYSQCSSVRQSVYTHTHTIRFQILFHYSFLHGIERYPVLYRLFMYLIHVRAR